MESRLVLNKSKGKTRERERPREPPRQPLLEPATASQAKEQLSRTETLGGKEFVFPLDKRGLVAWNLLDKKMKVEYARAYCGQYGIANRGQMRYKKCGSINPFYSLKPEELMQQVLPKGTRTEVISSRSFIIPLLSSGNVDWKKFGKKKTVEYAKAYCKKRGITCSGELKREFGRLYAHLLHTGLLDKVFKRVRSKTEYFNGKKFVIPFDETGQILWKLMGKKKIVKYGKAYCEKHGITVRVELRSGKFKNSALAHKLNDLKLMQQVLPKGTRTEVISGREFILPTLTSGNINWDGMDEEELVAFGCAYCEANNIRSIYALRTKMVRLAAIMEKKGLAERIISGVIVEYEGRKFAIPVLQKRIYWSRMHLEARNTYAAALCRAGNHSVGKLPSGLYRLTDKQKLRQYKKELPALAKDLDELSWKYRKGIPKDVLWAYGYEPYSMTVDNIQIQGIRKLEAVPVDNSSAENQV